MLRENYPSRGIAIGEVPTAHVATRPAIGAVATVFLPDGTHVSREVDGGAPGRTL